MNNKKTIFITGANRGIGLAMVKESLKNNTLEVHLTGKRIDELSDHFCKFDQFHYPAQ